MILVFSMSLPQTDCGYVGLEDGQRFSTAQTRFLDFGSIMLGDSSFLAGNFFNFSISIEDLGFFFIPSMKNFISMRDIMLKREYTLKGNCRNRREALTFTG